MHVLIKYGVVLCAVLSLDTLAMDRCASLASAYAEAPGVLTQTLPGTCGPVCLTNAISTSLRVLDLEPTQSSDSTLSYLLSRTEGQAMVLKTALDGLTDLYSRQEGLEFDLGAFSAMTADRREEFEGKCRFLDRLTVDDFAVPDPAYELSYAIINGRFYDGPNYIGTHAFMYLGRNAPTRFMLSDPRGGREPFTTQFSPFEINRLGYQHKVTVLLLAPDQLPPVYSFAGENAMSVITSGIKVKLRRTAPRAVAP